MLPREAWRASEILLLEGWMSFLTARVFEAVSGDQWESDQAPPEDNVVEHRFGVSIGAAADEATHPQPGTHLDGRKEPYGPAFAADKRIELIGLKLDDLEVPQHSPVEALCGC